MKKIRTECKPQCYCCGSAGDFLYKSLKDRLFGVSDEWSLKKCKNKKCGLIWLDPVPIKEDIHMAYEIYYTHKNTVLSKSGYLNTLYKRIKKGYHYFKYGYHKYSLSVFDKTLGLIAYLFPFRRAHLDFEVFYLPFQNNGKLLEIGCGNGQMLRKMNVIGWDVEGIDFDPAAVRMAKDNGVKVSLGDLLDQNFPSDTFDAIVMSHVVEHVYDPKILITECLRIMKKGATLLMITPNSTSLGHIIYKNNWRGLEPPRHIHLFNLKSARKLFDGIIFSKLELTTTVRDANNLLIASNSIMYSDSSGIGTPSNFWINSFSFFLQLIEWILIKFNSRFGEELVIKVKK